MPFPLESPTRARLGVGGFLCAMSFILYLDRVCMAQAVPKVQAEFDLSGTQMALVMMAFTLAYGLFEIPSGHWGDRLGARPVLTRIVVCWSVETKATRRTRRGCASTGSAVEATSRPTARESARRFMQKMVLVGLQRLVSRPPPLSEGARRRRLAFRSLAQRTGRIELATT